MARKSTTKTINFEKSLKQLETLVEKLEKGELSLEESLKQFEQGIKLTRECRQALQNAEQKISILSNENGEWVEKISDDGELLEND
ncbi:MAG: exodeoxyribonuclease VII small subunit [Gammaproteobacteria bacterium]